MVAPAVIAAGVGAAADLAGALLSKPNNHAGRDARQALDYSIKQSVLGKVQAAKEAGVSPLYALGAPVMGTSWGSGGGDRGLGEALSSMGQDVSRAVAAGQTSAERQLEDLTLQKAALENEYLRAQIGSIRVNTALQGIPPRTGGIPENVQPVQATPGANWLGMDWYSRPDTSDFMQYLEDHLMGDDNPLSWPIGLLNTAAGADYNLSRRLPAGYRTPAELGTTVRRWLMQ